VARIGSFLFIFLTIHLSANVFLPDLRQKPADEGSGKNMIGRNMGIKNLAEHGVFSSLASPTGPVSTRGCPGAKANE
jgi:hypothetical protein